jgi:hypothetical protein
MKKSLRDGVAPRVMGLRSWEVRRKPIVLAIHDVKVLT